MSDGAKHPRMRRRLLWALGAPLLLWAVFCALTGFGLARRLSDDAYDQTLGAAAEGLAMSLESDADDDLPAHLADAQRLMARLGAPDRWHYLVLAADGRALAGDEALRGLAGRPPPGGVGFHTARLGDEVLRVATCDYLGHHRRATLLVATTLQRREAAARALLGAMLWPNLGLLLLVLPIVWFGVRFALRPLERLGEQIAAHPSGDLTELPLAGTPRETLPLMRELNGLLARVRDAARGQQAFLNHAAHQLRTPLATLQTQIELWRVHPERADPERLAMLHGTVLRLAHLTHQLLALGRADKAAAASLAFAPVDVAALLERAAASLDGRAAAQGVEVAFELAAAPVRGVEWMLREMLDNLVDNALAHAPRGSEIVLRCGRRSGTHTVFVEIEDAGPGIPQAQRRRVFEPFVRLDEARRAGSGLGLAIVRAIADRHGATVRLDPGPGERGTLACIEFA